MSGSPAPPGLAPSQPAPPPARSRTGLAQALASGYQLAARVAARRWACLLAVGCIFAIDLPFRWQGWSFGLRGLMDSPCHLATGLICLGAITRVRRRPPPASFGMPVLAASVLLDLDHLPQEFGTSVLTAGTPRPYTHALWVVATFAVAAGCWALSTAGAPGRRTAPLVLFGCACGVADHLARDIAYAPAPLWWPFTTASVQVPYAWYAAALLVVAVMPVRLPARKKAHA